MSEQGRRRFSVYHTMGTLGTAFIVILCIVMGGRRRIYQCAQHHVHFRHNLFFTAGQFQ